MVSEAGVPEVAHHEIPRELLQPLVPHYEMALSQLEKIVKVSAFGPRWGFCKSSSALVMSSHILGKGGKQEAASCHGTCLLSTALVVSQL